MGEYQSVPPALAGLLSNIERRHVAANSASEADRPVPAGRIGEHEVCSGGPGRERPELWRPRNCHCRQAQQITPGWVAGVSHRMGLKGPTVRTVRAAEAKGSPTIALVPKPVKRVSLVATTR